MNTRETQFAGFAKLLVDNLFNRGRVWVDDAHRERWETTIAECAYDLVGHTLSSVAPIDLDRLSIEELVAKIPDLTMWPEDSPDALQHYTCAVCSKTYTGTLRDIQGWYGYQETNGDKCEIFAFCSRAHLDQWKQEHDHANV